MGLLVGDALGVPYEFHAAAALPPAAELEMTPPSSFRRAHAGTPPGTFSDDGAQALCLLSSLLDRGALDLGDFARRLVAWLDEGYLAVDARIFDVGIQSRVAIESVKRGTSPQRSGGTNERSNGNGSLMRLLPLSLWHRGSDEALARDAAAQSSVTHAHPRSQACCVLYSLWARRLLEGTPEAWADAVRAARPFVDAHELEEAILPAFSKPMRGTGYVVDSLRAAVGLNQLGSYEAVVKAAIALGDDTDTTACIAGGIAGIRFGVEGIPERWREALRGRELYEPLLARLLDAAP